MAKKVNITEEQYERIRQVYTTGEKSILSLAHELGVDRLVVKRGAREMGLTKHPTINSHSGIKIEWTPEMIQQLKDGYNNPYITAEDLAAEMGIASCTIQYKAKELGMTKVRKTAWNADKLEALQQLAKECTILQLSKHLDICEETVMQKVKELNIKYYKRPLLTKEEKQQKAREYKAAHNVKYQPRMINRMYPSIVVKGDNGRKLLKADFVLTLGNPRLAAPDIADMYDISNSTVLFWRKKLYGKLKLQLDTTGRITTAERAVMSILDSLDYAYVPHKKVENKVVDIYLGSKRFIEVDGTYWHKKLKRRIKDYLIRRSYVKKGYSILVIKEKDLKKTDYLREQIKSFMMEDSLISNGKLKTA